MSNPICLYGRILLEGNIHALTGLRVGGSPGALAIGGVDLPVIRNVVTQRPYIPGSSLKGKMRSLWEKSLGLESNFTIGRTQGKEVRIHMCTSSSAYATCKVCPIYGTTGDGGASSPTRIVVRDVDLDVESLNNAKTDMPFTEVKWEAAIDRVTSAATPRQIERVPAGARFKEMQIVFNIYDAADHKRFLDVLTALQLVEDDYLGGQGSRGSGRVRFEDLKITCKSTKDYAAAPSTQALASLVVDRAALLVWLQQSIPVTSNGGD